MKLIPLDQKLRVVEPMLVLGVVALNEFSGSTLQSEYCLFIARISTALSIPWPLVTMLASTFF